MTATILSLALFCAAAPPVETSKTPETFLYVRTSPSGAEILVDGKPLGTSPGLFKVPPGVCRIVVELDGYQPGDQEVTIKPGHVQRLVLRLTRQPAVQGEVSSDPVAEVLSQFQKAVNEMDSKKLEALFLPPDDTPAGEARRKHLEDARGDFSRSNRRPTEVRLTRTKETPEGKDKLVDATMVARGAIGDGQVLESQATLQFRLTPTESGWKIAELSIVEGKAIAPLPSPQAAEDENLQRRRVEKKVSDFPETVDLSTPESACAAYHRASARMDAKGVVDLCWVKIDPAGMDHFWRTAGADDLAVYNQAQLEAEIIEVWIYRQRLATVISRLAFPPGKGRHPYSRRSFGLIEGQWKNLGEDRCPSLEDAEAMFLEKKDRAWEHFRRIEEALTVKEPAITPAPAAEAERRRHFVRLVVDKHMMTFEGRKSTWLEMPGLLEKVPDREHTVLEIARASDDVTLREWNEAVHRAVALAQRFGFEYLSQIGVHPLGSKGTPTQTLPERQAPSVPQPPKKVHLPDADTRGAEVVLDLASGQKLRMDPAALNPDSPGPNIDVTVFTRQGRGDLMFDRVLGCLRGAKAMRWDGNRFVPLPVEEQVQDATVYKLPEVPCRLLVTTAERKRFDVTIVAVTKDGGIDLEYRPADSPPVPAPSDQGISTSPEPEPARAGIEK